MWSTYIMDLLLLLQAYGSSPDPKDDAYALDFNGNGIIFTETSEEEVAHCYLYPIIEKMVREEFYDLKDMALSIKVTWV